jgi:phospholipase/carboxylesterase
LKEIARLDGPRVAPTAGGPARQLVILLHGYGANGEDLIGLAPHFARVLPEAAFVAPDGPEPCAGQPFGRQWWGIDSFSRQERFLGTLAAAPVLDAFIDAELQGHRLDESKLVLVGFSQGTMMALHVGPRRQRPLAGIIGYSGALVAPERLPDEARSQPPVLLVHGDRDELVPAESTLEAAEGLASAGIQVEWHFSPGQGHTIAPDGLSLGTGFLARTLGAGPGPQRP